MDGSRFDELTRMLGRSTSRRRTLGALALAAVGALGRGGAPSISAQAPACGPDDLSKDCGGCGVCRPSGKNDIFGRSRLICSPAPFRCMGEGTSDDNCPDCNPTTLTCTAGRKCGPCESCVQNRPQSCSYSASGRDGHCVDPATKPCMRATGKCGCDDPLIYCDPDCVDPRNDAKHCGRCHKRCNPCERCRHGRCVRCDRVCERCNSGGECESTCTDTCFPVCESATCVEPDPPVCVCGDPSEGQPPAAKRIYLPVVGAQGGDTAGVEPCGEGDARQCCVPEECMTASEGGQVCCPPDGVCGNLCCKFGEQCTSAGCCCPQSQVAPSGHCHQCL